MASVAGGRGRPDGYLCLCWPGAGSPSSSPFPLPCYDRTSWHDTTPRVVGEEAEMQAIFWFWFLFGAVAGMAALPHLQRIAAQVRRTLAELDQPKQPNSR